MMVSMAETYFTMGDYRQGYEFLDKVLDQEPVITEAGDLAIISYAYGVKMTWLEFQGRYDEALKTGEKRIRLIGKLENMAGVPEGYADQQKAYTYAKIASTAEAKGDTPLARDAFNKFMATDFGNSQVGRVYIVNYLLASKQWDKVLEFTRRYIRYLKTPIQSITTITACSPRMPRRIAARATIGKDITC